MSPVEFSTAAYLIGGFAVSLLTVVLLLPPIRRWALWCGLVDHPDGRRKQHAFPIPHVGGLAIAGGFVAGMLFFGLAADHMALGLTFPQPAFWLGAVLIVGVGLYDDARDLRFNYKFMAQAVAAYLLLLAGYRIDVSVLPFVEADIYQQTLYTMPLTVIWVLAVMNAVNLLDGLDGLAAGVSLIAFASLATAFGVQGGTGGLVLTIVMAGALVGFLMFNFNPATIFMGDCGSLFLGYTLAAYSLGGTEQPPTLPMLLIPVAALGLPIIDTTVAILRRLIARKPLFAADGDHIHHRLLRRNTHRGAVIRLYIVSGACGAMAVLLAVVGTSYWLPVVSVAATACYVWLRALGYLRVRASLETINREYGARGLGGMDGLPAGLEPEAKHLEEAPLKDAEYA